MAASVLTSNSVAKTRGIARTTYHLRWGAQHQLKAVNYFCKAIYLKYFQRYQLALKTSSERIIKSYFFSVDDIRKYFSTIFTRSFQTVYQSMARKVILRARLGTKVKTKMVLREKDCDFFVTCNLPRITNETIA